MQHSGFISSDVDLSESHVSQLSNFNFELKNTHHFQADQTVVINTMSDQSDSMLDLHENQQIHSNNLVKKLYVKDLQVAKEKPQKFKVSNKENNIPNQPTNQPYVQSRRIIIHKNPSTISPYRTPQAVDESFTTNKIVQLQQELISLRKQMGLKQSGWIKEKSMLMGRMQMNNLQVAEMKQRNNNLIQINQTLTQALGQTVKNQVIGEYQNKIQEMSKQLTLRNKKIQALEQSISRMEKQKIDQNLRQKEDKERIEYLGKTLEEYKLLVKESNERKFESDEKMVMIGKSIDVIRVKLNELPIKNEYLKPVFLLLNILMESTQNMQVKENYQNHNITRINPNNTTYIRNSQRDNIQSLDISQIKKPFEAHQPGNKNNLHKGNTKKPQSQNTKYREQQSFINQLNDISDNNRFNLDEQSSHNNFFNQDNSQSREMLMYQTQKQQNQDNLQRNNSFYHRNHQDQQIQESYYDLQQNNMAQNKRKHTFHNLILDHQNVKRIDTSEDQYEAFSNNNNRKAYSNNINSNKSYSNNTNNKPYKTNSPPYIQPQSQQQQQQQVYLCQVCHRVYAHQQFLNHMKQCQQYETLLNQKKLIESKLISINQIDYQTRKSHNNSLNSSAILLNKSRSKTKLIKPIEQPVLTARTSHNNHNHRVNRDGASGNRSRNQRENYTNRKENLTERYIYREDNQEALQMSQLMNISSISIKPTNFNLPKDQRQHRPNHKPLISPNKYYETNPPQPYNHHQNYHQNNQVLHKNHQNYHQNHQIHYQNQEDSGFFNNPNAPSHKYNKGSPQIKYQSNIQKMNNNNVGKQSMQQEIRKIVQAINEGKSSKSRPDSFSSKVVNKNHKIQSNRKEFIPKSNKNNSEFY